MYDQGVKRPIKVNGDQITGAYCHLNHLRCSDERSCTLVEWLLEAKQNNFDHIDGAIVLCLGN